MPATATATAPDLTDMLDRCRNHGLMGVTICRQGAEYVALTVKPNGQPGDIRNWNPAPTPEAALADLAARL